MRNAAKVSTLLFAVLAVAACHRQSEQNQPDNQEISIDDNLGQATSQIPANAEIETLPQDESSATPSNQLQSGFDKPDVNDLGNSD